MTWQSFEAREVPTFIYWWWNDYIAQIVERRIWRGRSLIRFGIRSSFRYRLSKRGLLFPFYFNHWHSCHMTIHWHCWTIRSWHGHSWGTGRWHVSIDMFLKHCRRFWHVSAEWTLSKPWKSVKLSNTKWTRFCQTFKIEQRWNYFKQPLLKIYNKWHGCVHNFQIGIVVNMNEMELVDISNT